jgi:hypothetical protein
MRRKLIFSHFIVHRDSVWQYIAVASKKSHYLVGLFFKGIDMFC